MTRTQKFFSVAVIVVVGIGIIGATFDAQAFGRKDKGEDGFPGRPPFQGMDFDIAGRILSRLTKALDLTPEQQGEITTIMATFREEQKARMQDQMKAHRDMMKQLLSEEFDEAKVREAYQQMEAEREKMREDGFVERAKLMAQIKAVLTPEQIATLEEKMDAFLEGDRPMFDRDGGPGGFPRPGFNR